VKDKVIKKLEALLEELKKKKEDDFKDATEINFFRFLIPS
jgi:hypothetical protein